MKIKNLTLLLISLLLIGCTNAVYVGSQDVDPNGWNEDSILAYTFAITDTTATYDILIHVRHQDNYPYQNMWLFVGDNDSIMTDTIEFYMADDHGRWLGNHRNGHYTMPVLYEQQYRFSHSGEQHLYIQHGMRDPMLRGISDVSVEVMANQEK